jgi:myosin heavy subunit
VDAILSVIATILHLGNVDFDDSTFTDNTPCSIKNTPSLDASAKVLSVNLDAYTKALLYKTREVAK